MSSARSPLKVHKCRDMFDRECPECWEKRLKRMNLTMDRGRKIGSESLTYGHMVAGLDWDGKVTFKPPTGERLDNDEWPVSLL